MSHSISRPTLMGVQPVFYTVKHITRFEYSAAITESVTEVRMQPITDAQQVCRDFQLNVNPPTRVAAHTDHLGNMVHHFDIPRPHTQLVIGARSMIEVRPHNELPERLDLEDWQTLDEQVEEEDLFAMLMPSKFACASELLHKFALETGTGRQLDPLTAVLQLNQAIYDGFEYRSQSTLVDSPIDVALESRRGVCQDYSHIMITVLREVLRIPARYVSGYLFHRIEDKDRSAADATHAWVEAYLPRLGWLGLDPTNNLVARERHIRVAVGRDYSDVPPTRGVHKGGASSELSVAVQVSLAEAPDQEVKPVVVSTWHSPVEAKAPLLSRLDAQQQQQQ